MSASRFSAHRIYLLSRFPSPSPLVPSRSPLAAAHPIELEHAVTEALSTCFLGIDTLPSLATRPLSTSMSIDRISQSSALPKLLYPCRLRACTHARSSFFPTAYSNDYVRKRNALTNANSRSSAKLIPIRCVIARDGGSRSSERGCVLAISPEGKSERERESPVSWENIRCGLTIVLRSVGKNKASRSLARSC